MLLWILAAFVSTFVKGMCGFGDSLIFGTILASRADNIVITPVQMLISTPANVVLVVNNRKDFNWKIYLPTALLMIAGSIPGTFLLKSVDPRPLKAAFGVLIMVLSVIEYFMKKKGVGRLNPVGAVILNVLAGLASGVFGVGMLLAAYVQGVTKNVREFKGTIGAIFLTESALRVILYTAQGIMNVAALKRTAVVFPFAMAGLAIGVLLGNKIKENYITNIIIVTLFISGALLIITNIV